MNKSILITFAGGLLSAVLTFFVNIIAAKYLIVREFTQFAVFINSTVILSAVFEFGLSSSLVVIYKKKGRHYCEVLSSHAIFLMCILFIVISPILYAYWSIGGVICLLASFLITVHKILNVFNQIDELWGRYSFNNILCNFVKLNFVLFAVILHPENVIYALWALAIAYIVSIIYMISGRNIKLRLYKDGVNFRTEFNLLFKFYLITAIVALLMRVDVLIINYVGLNAADYFIASTLCMLIPLLNSSVTSVLVKVGTNHVRNKHKIRLIIFIILGYLLCSKYVITILYDEQYKDATNIMYILAVAYAIGLYFTDKESELYHQSNNRLLYLKISQLSVLAFGSFPLLFYMGETGMACAVLLSRLSGWVYLITMCKNEQKK